jgi:hypothetical protein
MDDKPKTRYEPSPEKVESHKNNVSYQLIFNLTLKIV